MSHGRRIVVLLVAAGIIGAPAIALRVACVGRSCDPTGPAGAQPAFCTLPAPLRRAIVAGFLEERSPDLIALAGMTPVVGSSGSPSQTPPPWPSLREEDSGRVPIVFLGTGVAAGALVPPGTGVIDIAPTLAEILGLRRAHPEVRSGRAVAGVAEPSSVAPRLILLVVWKGTGSVELDRAPGSWSFLRDLMEQGGGTLDGVVGSLPLDPAAVLATIGTGGLPSEHGIVGSVLRGRGGAVVSAWSPGAPISVIASLGDDLDQSRRQRALIGLVGTDPSDRGAIGGNWYLPADRDRMAFPDGGVEAQEAAVLEMLESGFGGDPVPDLLVAVMEGPVRKLDAALGRIVARAGEVSGGSVALAVTGTGTLDGSTIGAPNVLDGAEVVQAIETQPGVPDGVVGGFGPGGVFLDQSVLTASRISEDLVARALLAVRAPDGSRAVAEVFPSIAVALARYC